MADAGDFEFSLLHQWSRVRGPLFDEPRSVVCRILALTAAGALAHDSDDPDLRLRASRVVDEALGTLPDSNRPSSRAGHARACALLVDVRRLLRAAADERELAEGLRDLFEDTCDGHYRTGRPAGYADIDLGEVLRCVSWGQMLASTLMGEDPARRLRAARSLLARTRDAWRRMGRQRPFAEGEEEAVRETLREIPQWHADSRSKLGLPGHEDCESYRAGASAPATGPP